MIDWYSSWRSDTRRLAPLGVAPQRGGLETLTYLGELDRLQHVRGERARQELARGAPGDAAALEGAQRRLVQAAHRRAVGALHVVGEDLQLRLRVDLRLLGQEQGVVRLLAVGLLRRRVDVHLAVEHAVRRAVEDALVVLAAVAVRLHVLDAGLVVD